MNGAPWIFSALYWRDMTFTTWVTIGVERLMHMTVSVHFFGFSEPFYDTFAYFEFCLRAEIKSTVLLE